MQIAANSLLFVFPVLASLVEHASSTLLALMTLLGIYQWIRSKEKIKFSRDEKLVLYSFLIYPIVCVSFILIHGLFLPGYQAEWDHGHEIRMIAFIPLYYLFLKTALRAKAFWFGISLGAIINGIYACIYIYLLDAGTRASGGYHPIAFGDASIALGFMSIAGLQHFHQKHKLMTLIPLSAFVLGLMAAFLSGTKGALIAAPLLILVLLIQVGSHPKRWTIRAAAVTALIIISLGGYFMPGSPMDDRIHEGIERTMAYFGDGQTDAEPEKRLKMWSVALSIIRDNPWMGLGKEGYHQVVKDRAHSDPEITDILKYGTPHNMYLTNMTSFGIAGLIVLLAVFIAPAAVFIKWLRRDEKTRPFAYAGIIAIAAYMQFALTESIFARNINISFYLILTASALALCRLKKNAAGTGQ
ncbi:MAG: O-antigen ligase family protein [Desulfobacterales bacterium]